MYMYLFRMQRAASRYRARPVFPINMYIYIERDQLLKIWMREYARVRTCVCMCERKRERENYFLTRRKFFRLPINALFAGKGKTARDVENKSNCGK